MDSELSQAASFVPRLAVMGARISNRSLKTEDLAAVLRRPSLFFFRTMANLMGYITTRDRVLSTGLHLPQVCCLPERRTQPGGNSDPLVLAALTLA